MGDGIRITAVPAEDLPAVEVVAERLFKRFNDRFPDETDWSELLEKIKAESQQLWLVYDGDDAIALALTFLEGNAKKTCVISHCAGARHEQWTGQLLATIRVWSNSLGSTKLEIVARPGWERVLRPFGMVKTLVILELKDDGQEKQPNL